eukprot:scaffold245763_cov31-Tisochrysis_lutea.AAC.8
MRTTAPLATCSPALLVREPPISSRGTRPPMLGRPGRPGRLNGRGEEPTEGDGALLRFQSRSASASAVQSAGSRRPIAH